MNVETILKSKGSRVVTVAPGDTVGRALSVLEAHDIGALVVSADRLTVQGIVSIGDVVKNRLGEIESEKDALREYIVRG